MKLLTDGLRFGVMATLLAPFFVQAAVSVNETTVDGKPMVTVENEYFKAVISPAECGEVKDFFDKTAGKGFMFPKEWGAGLFIELEQNQPEWGALWVMPYQCRVEKKDTVVEVQLERRLTEKLKYKEWPEIKDLVVKKVYRVKEGDPVMDLSYTLENASPKGKVMSPWIQSITALSQGNDAKDIYSRAWIHGIQKLSRSTLNPAMWWGAFSYDPTAGWMAMTHAGEKRGLLFTMDYNDLKTQYNCLSAYTTEWFYDKIPIPAGRSWTTRMSVRPLPGFESVSYASERLVADLNWKVEGGKLVFTHTLAVYRSSLERVTITSELVDRQTGASTKLTDAVVEQLGLSASAAKQELNDPGAGRYLMKVRVAGNGWQEAYEYPFDEDRGAPRAVRLKVGHVYDYYDWPERYETMAPKKQKVFLKPEKIELKQTKEINVLFLTGHASDIDWKIESAGTRKCGEFKLKGGKYTYNYSLTKGNYDYFPTDYDELLGFRGIVFAHCDAADLDLFGCEYVNDLVIAGGGALFLGGYGAYGNGRIKGSRLADLLPVEIEEVFDLQEAKNGKIIVKTPDDPLLKGLPWDKGPEVIWYHKVKPKSGARVLLEVEGNPLLVVWERGKGRVVAFTGSVLGLPEQDRRPFWKWEGYEEFMGRLLTWMTGENSNTQP